ncbi:MAG: CRTAC1 family protein [Verrucomicrobia subdivision 3 bacterium]|nr:CRTAC1 family protein [Limisphaerales bacterium]
MKQDNLDKQKTAVLDESEETVHLDDAVIGRAFRGSVIALVAIVLIAGGAIWYAKRKPKPGPAKLTTLASPVSPQHATEQMPTVKFTDITAAAGINFIHNNGAYGDKLLPETMGSGVAVLDFDNDGDQDLLFVNSTYWPGKVPDGRKPTTPALYRNEGGAKFSDVTAGSGMDVSFYGMGVAAGDYDNDGRVDLLFTAVGENRLFHNEGAGKFKEVTREAGVAGTPSQWSTAAAWLDYDNDGDLDLYVGRYVKWSRGIDFEVGYKLVGIGRAYGPPMNFEGAFASFYRNEGGGRFTDVSKEAGVEIRNPSTGVPAAKTLGVAPIDLDDDGWIDLVVANDTVQNYVFHNQKNGAFKEIGAASGVAFDSYGNTRGAMGIDAARYRDGKTVGIAIGNFANEMTALYVAQDNAGLIFTDEAISEGIGPMSRLPLKFGIVFFDFDLDGRLDVLSVNGHLEEEISKIQQSQKYAQPAQLFWNTGARSGAGFALLPPERSGPDIVRPIVGRGSAFGDLDNDGDLDTVFTQTGGAPLVLRNDQGLNHHWLRLKLVGKRANRDAIGAWIRVKVGDQVIARQVMPTRSYLSQSELPVTVGLGSERQFTDLEVVWPGGQVQKVANARVDSLTVVEQAQ